MSNSLNMKISKEDALRLNNLAKLTNRPKSFYVRKLIHEYLNHLENIYLSEKALEELRADKIKKEVLTRRVNISIKSEND